MVVDIKSYSLLLFTLKDLGLPYYFLGVEVLQKKNGTFTSHAKYITDIVTDTNLNNNHHITCSVDICNNLTRPRKAIADAKVCRRL